MRERDDICHSAPWWQPRGLRRGNPGALFIIWALSEIVAHKERFFKRPQAERGQLIKFQLLGVSPFFSFAVLIPLDLSAPPDQRSEKKKCGKLPGFALCHCFPNPHCTAGGSYVCYIYLYRMRQNWSLSQNEVRPIKTTFS